MTRKSAAKATSVPDNGREIEWASVESLQMHPRNPRQGDKRRIDESIRVNGWYGVVVAQRSTRRVIVGNHRLQVAKENGLAEIPVHWLDVDDAMALRILLADNRTSDRGRYDERTLAEELERLSTTEELLGTGWSSAEMKALINKTSSAKVEPVLDEVRFSLQIDDLTERQQHTLMLELGDRGFKVKTLMY